MAHIKVNDDEVLLPVAEQESFSEQTLLYAWFGRKSSMACFRFREGDNEKVKEVFRNHYKKLYSKWLSVARREAHKKAHTSEICDALKPYNPNWLSQQVWSEMIDVWKEQAWKSKSAGSKKNRGKLTVYHISGSVPFSKHMVDLAATKKRTPTLIEVWDRIHKRKQGNGVYINARAREIVTEYHAKVGGPAEDGKPEIDDLAIWSEITGRTKKIGYLVFPDIVHETCLVLL